MARHTAGGTARALVWLALSWLALGWLAMPAQSLSAQPAPLNGGLAPGGSLLTFSHEVLPSRSLLATLTPPAAAGSHGQMLFDRHWRVAEHGVGPEFDATSCTACHLEGRPSHERFPAPLVVRGTSVESIRVFGRQLRQRSATDEPPHARITTVDVPLHGHYLDGTGYTLTRPVTVARAAGTTAHEVALRAAPALFGWGLLEAVPERQLLAFADPHDSNADGISGRPARTADGAFGRVGLKAEHATLRDQVAAALANDMGIGSASHPDPGCLGCPAEISESAIDALDGWLQSLGVFERRARWHEDLLRGEQLFARVGCHECHRPVLVTGAHASAAISHQIIWPYTDLLLHDMGAELAEPGRTGDASASEWRTPPLWGIGALLSQWPERGWLHDGRARTLAEAVLWHGGEAEAARESFRALEASDRVALLAFLRAL